MVKIKLKQDSYNRVKNYITKNGHDIDGAEEYTIDEINNNKQYDFTVCFDDDDQEIEVIEGYSLEQKDGYMERGYELMEEELCYLFEKFMEKIENNA